MWRRVRIEEAADIISGGTPSRLVPKFWGDGIAWATPTDITACRRPVISETADSITREGLLNSSAKPLPTGSILLTSRATIGEARIAGVPISTNQGFKSLVPKPGYDATFLYYQILALRGQFERHGVGSTFAEISKRDVARVEFDCPDNEEEQRRIGHILWSVDTQITHTEALTAKQEQVRAGLMQDLFTRGVDETGRLRPPREDAPELYHETALGWLPKEWETVRVRDIAHVVRGSTPRPAKDPRFFYGNFVPWITVGELSRDDWPYLERTSSQLTELGAGFSRFLPSGTLVVSNSGYGCGVPKILKISGCANDGIAALLSLSNAFDQLFLYYFFYHNIDALRMRVARGNDQPNLNIDIIGDLRMPRPAKHEQKSIADLVWCVQQTIRRQREETGKLHHLRTALLRDLLAPPAAATAEPRIAAE